MSETAEMSSAEAMRAALIASGLKVVNDNALKVDSVSKGEEAPVDAEAARKPLSAKSTYYYAHNRTSAEGPKTLVGAQEIYNHKALDAEEAQKLADAEVNSAGKSAWNKGGTTWEEKDHSKWAKDKLTEALLAMQISDIEFTEVSAVEDCHASIVYTRGKKKAAITAESIKVSWNSKDKECKGNFEVVDLASHALEDMQIKVRSPTLKPKPLNPHCRGAK
ncbi:hypothetical protein T484DRAFT_2254815 [Baffinella frigidus]|nr:hypothetical protein T484DRAFT_2254815 [Cryptophyta sp. CCMP2293]